MAKHRPPMWSSKLYGEPHGAWESEAGSVAAGGAAPASPFARPNERLLYIEEALRDAIRRRVDPKLRKDQQPRTFLENILKKGDVAVVSARRKVHLSQLKAGTPTLCWLAPLFLPACAGPTEVRMLCAAAQAEEIAKLTKTEVKVPRVKLSGKRFSGHRTAILPQNPLSPPPPHPLGSLDAGGRGGLTARPTAQAKSGSSRSWTF